MPFMYPLKHVFRNWKLFAALLIGITLAATFFAGMWVKSDVAAEQSFNKQLNSIRTDILFYADLNQTQAPMVIKDTYGISGVKSVDMIARFFSNLGFPADNYTYFAYTPIISFPNTSRIYNEWINKPQGGIPENYTYVVTGTQLAERVAVGDIITAQLDFREVKYYNYSQFDVNLTVAGFAELTDDGYAYSAGDFNISPYASAYRSDILIIDWDNTLMKLWSSTLDSSTVGLTYFIDVDRQDLLNPYDIDNSIGKIYQVSNNIQNRVLGNYLSWGYVQNLLGDVLGNYEYRYQNMYFNFILVSIPIIFVAWYLGYTVSDVSFNIRRREIGLLSTKGLSSGQIQWMFLTEALVIGVIGGLLGIVGGLILNQYYADAINVSRLFSSEILNPIVAVATLLFAVILAVVAVFWSARKASRIAAVDALRNYVPSSKPSRKIFPIIALILGGYKIVIFLLGVNISELIAQSGFFYGNMFLSGFASVLILFDGSMTFIGPLLFFWGFTKLLIRDSAKFQAVATKISSVMGELGALAAKNVRRNPGRLAAMAFLIALIVGLSVQVTGQIASQEDYIVRDVRTTVGADITVLVANASRSQEILYNITQNVPGIRNASIEQMLPAYSIGGRNSYMNVKTIDPSTWALSAYYEDGWFTGGPSVAQMLRDLQANNNTIIIDRGVAKQLDLQLYDEITIDFTSCARRLKIVGFFGPEPPDTNGIGITPYASFNSYFSANLYSFVPRNLFNMTAGSDIYTLENWFTNNILISLNPGVNSTEVVNKIRSLKLDVYGIESFDAQWQRSIEMEDLNTYSSLQVLEMQNFGLIFAVLSASVGTALIAIVSLKERSREATLMSVRGLSYRQLVWMFLTESIAIITFAVILGVVIGVIVAYGNIAATNTSLSYYSLVTQHLVFPPNALTIIGTYVGLIYASTIGAVLVMTSQYVTKLERMIRTR
ncbi:MAG: ABC transporter permease [Nitrososphaerota archaeon]|jgi:ABC-type lipoprotein release transport system permease subunit|nr:ABC transporter permease [Nitrososphaerota archaeon]